MTQISQNFIQRIFKMNLINQGPLNFAKQI